MPPQHELCFYWANEVKRVPLPAEGTLHIGRSEGNEVRIDHPSVSRRHAVLEVGKNITIRDLGGANGTFVRDVRGPRVAGETENLRQLSNDAIEVAIGEPIMVGVVTFVVRRTPDEPAFSELDGSAGESERFIIRDPSMRALYDQAARAARALISVLVLGETGVGKEVLARAIHARSPRASGPFMGLNCAALAESILESELFGHEKGAFTGALQTRPGLFEAADGGTVFLDEVGELPAATQAKLLRVLEDRTVTRLGARAPRAIDVRFVSATNRDLEAAVERGTFRQDLYFRLNGISLTIPPLRERQAEIEPLARSFVAGCCRGLDREGPLGITEEAMAALRAYDWPGNVRELRNVIERAVVLCTGAAITPENLPRQLVDSSYRKPPSVDRLTPVHGAPRTSMASEPGAPSADSTTARADSLKAEIRDLERARLVEALQRSGGNQTEAAKILGISRRTLVTRLSEFNLPRPRKG
jgi:DNA-binding NtrC family response regulator